MNKIYRGVSLYSYQQEYHSRKLSIEDCIAEVEKLGCDGIEIISEMMIPNFPSPGDAWIEKWFGWLEKHHCKAICYDAFMDGWLHRDRLISDDEAVLQMNRDIILAKTLGFKVIRVLGSIPHDIVERCIPLAEKHDIVLASEMHTPDVLDEITLEYYASVVRRNHNTKHFGITMDLGCFMQRPLYIDEAKAIRQGGREEVVKYITASFLDGVPKEKLISEIEKKNGNEAEKAWINGAYRLVSNDPKLLRDFIPYLRHVHGKFYEMNEDCVETCIPNDLIVKELLDANWEGYICSEFEGQRAFHDIPDMVVDSVEQVRRQHVQLKRLLGH